MPTALGARNIFDGTAVPVTSAMKANFGNLRDYLASLLGTTGLATDARQAIGVGIVDQNIQAAAYTLALTDIGKMVYHQSAVAHTYTIPANASVAFPIGSVITMVNQNGGGVVTIAITTDTLRWAGGSSVGSRLLAANGLVTLLKISATEWMLSGTGVT